MIDVYYCPPLTDPLAVKLLDNQLCMQYKPQNERIFLAWKHLNKPQKERIFLAWKYLNKPKKERIFLAWKYLYKYLNFKSFKIFNVKGLKFKSTPGANPIKHFTPQGGVK